MLKRIFAPALFVLSACSGGSSGAGDAALVDYTTINVETDTKALVYNLIGRWFPVEEIKRLSDDGITPTEWCQRDPTMILVLLDEVEVQCEKGLPQEAAIARVERASGGIQLVLRAKDDNNLKSLLFTKALATSVEIAGSPCDNGEAHSYARFPRFETLEREILGGKRCAQINHGPILPPAEDDPP